MKSSRRNSTNEDKASRNSSRERLSSGGGNSSSVENVNIISGNKIKDAQKKLGGTVPMGLPPSATNATSSAGKRQSFGKVNNDIMSKVHNIP